ncbi:gliding motility-associated C-terminal domain-containing protein [Larkinella soli]|uniref:gliding motility-associated C-terminal domain-containing protein n=1 Tax=Larkinella soli TaxID=1770527 RepID=UPI0013E364B9|nr:gliding motility-associated C-terminal domain-containing protein [Larkinella soli]
MLFAVPAVLAQPDQCTPAAGTFTGSLYVTPGIGCVPLRVKTASGLKDARNIRYVYDYQGGAVRPAQITTDSVYTYRLPGLYRILQLSEHEGRQLVACSIVQVYDTLPPEVSVQSCGNRVSLSIPNAARYQYDFYRVDWGDGRTDSLDGLRPSAVHRFTGDDRRVIAVQGVHKYGNCGGTTRLSFRPSTSGQVPEIAAVSRVGAGELALQIRNPGGRAFRVEQRLPGGSFRAGAEIFEIENGAVRFPAEVAQVVCFRLSSVDTCSVNRYSPEVCYVPPAPEPPASADSAFFVPDAFSPNGDGINDRFAPLAEGISAYRLTVFNRWGEVVFRATETSDGWDGTRQGIALPAGSYAYRLEITRVGKRPLEKRGSVLLVR